MLAKQEEVTNQRNNRNSFNLGSESTVPPNMSIDAITLSNENTNVTPAGQGNNRHLPNDHNIANNIVEEQPRQQDIEVVIEENMSERNTQRNMHIHSQRHNISDRTHNNSLSQANRQPPNRLENTSYTENPPRNQAGKNIMRGVENLRAQANR